MFPNLDAEMARKKLTNLDCAKVCGITEKSFSVDCKIKLSIK